VTDTYLYDEETTAAQPRRRHVPPLEDASQVLAPGELMAKKTITKLAGYPLASFPYTTDPERCPNCGSDRVTLIGGFTSRQRIGVCQNCAANYIVEPAQAEATP
jgi:hypothetical protein